MGAGETAKFGRVRFRWTPRPWRADSVGPLTRDGVHGDWYVSILVEDGITTPAADPELSAVGIDRGVVVGFALSDGWMLNQQVNRTAEHAAIFRLQQQAKPAARTQSSCCPWQGR